MVDDEQPKTSFIKRNRLVVLIAACL